MVEYDEQFAQATERSYLMPEIINQRVRTLNALQLQAGEKVLDVGCGMGLLTRDMALAVGSSGQVTGVDVSRPMLDLARARCASLPQVTLHEESALSLSEPDLCYDVVTCTQLLLYLSDVRGALAEMYRVLKPQGRIAVVETDWRSVVFNTADPDFTQRLFEQWEASIPSPHLPAKLRGLLHDAGFTNVRAEAIPIMNTSYVPDNYSVGMVHHVLHNQVETGVVSQEKADGYLAGLKALSDSNKYFFCVNRFLFTALS